MTDSEVLSKLDPRVARWVGAQGWEKLRPVQREAVEPILKADTDVIITAPTAGGKTEAAFLPIFSHLLKEDKPGLRALCISPLKALINDQERRLEEMTRDIPVEVAAWHGDVPASRKAAVTRSPAGVLLITPESLEAMFALRPAWLRESVRNLDYVVVDELHSFFNSERGAQLQSLMTRLEQLAGRKIPRIALSATLGDMEAARRFLRPGGDMPFAAPDPGQAKQGVAIAVKEYVASASSNPEPLISEELFWRLRGTNNLVFTNSRKDAEAYAVTLSELSQAAGVPNEFRIHHGSLSRADREEVEKELQKGRTPVTAICTASMELGVDIGKVESVAQIGTAGSPSVLRQRLGRSGRRGAPAALRLYSVDEERDDYKFHLRSNLVQNVAVVELLRAGRFDAAPAPEAFMSVVVQQLVSLLAQCGSFYAAEAYRLLCSGGAFPFLTQEAFAGLLRYLGGKGVIVQLGSGQLAPGPESERMLGSRDFFSAFTSAKDYTVIEKSSRKTVGSVQYKPYYGEVFILAGEKWIVDSVEERSATVYVSRTVAKGKMMFEGTGIETSAAVTAEMRRVLGSNAEYPYLDPATGTPDQLAQARAWYRKRGLDEQPWISDAGESVWFTWGGMRANRTLAMLSDKVLGINPPYDHLAISGLSPSQVEQLRHHADNIAPGELGLQLAADVNRKKKERGKFDPYLPDSLLNAEYAATRLDEVAARAALSAAGAGS